MSSFSSPTSSGCSVGGEPTLRIVRADSVLNTLHSDRVARRERALLRLEEGAHRFRGASA
jgi:hypothetical protein